MKNWKFFVEYTDGSVETLSNLSMHAARRRYCKIYREFPENVKSFGYSQESV